MNLLAHVTPTEAPLGLIFFLSGFASGMLATGAVWAYLAKYRRAPSGD